MAFVARFLTLVALLVAPLGMVRAHAAVASAGLAASHAMAGGGGRCADRDQSAPHPDRAAIDCTIACAGVASLTTQVPARPSAPVAVETEIRPVATLHGLHPESDPPPPRFA